MEQGNLCETKLRRGYGNTEKAMRRSTRRQRRRSRAQQKTIDICFCKDKHREDAILGINANFLAEIFFPTEGSIRKLRQLFIFPTTERRRSCCSAAAAPSHGGLTYYNSTTSKQDGNPRMLGDFICEESRNTCFWIQFHHYYYIFNLKHNHKFRVELVLTSTNSTNRDSN